MLCNFAHNLAYHAVFKTLTSKLAEDSKFNMMWFWPGKNTTYSNFCQLLSYLQSAKNAHTIVVNGDDCVSSKSLKINGKVERVIFSSDATSFDCAHSEFSASVLKQIFGKSPLVSGLIENALGPSMVGFGTNQIYDCNHYFLKSGSSVTTLFNSVLRYTMEAAVLAAMDTKFDNLVQAQTAYEETFKKFWTMPLKKGVLVSTEECSINSHTLHENTTGIYKNLPFARPQYPVFVEFD